MASMKLIFINNCNDIFLRKARKTHHISGVSYLGQNTAVLSGGSSWGQLKNFRD